MKRLALATLALALPCALAAQAPAANPITAVFRTRTMTLQQNLAQAFDSIPESLHTYRPTPVQQTVGYIAQHLVTDNYIFCNSFGEKKATRAPEDGATPDSAKARWPRATRAADGAAATGALITIPAQRPPTNAFVQITMLVQRTIGSANRAGASPGA